MRHRIPTLLLLSAVPAAISGAATRQNSTPQTRNDQPFQPIVEAAMPEGFPATTPVGEIQLKKYPAYRMARASIADGRPFWKLFAHIKLRGIAMTSPVQMDYRPDAQSELTQKTMAFLYGNSGIGRVGKDGAVEVLDIPASIVVSIGMRGARTSERVRAASDQLRAWLDDRSDEFEATGGTRVMGYNSPFIPERQRYYEVQLPVSAKK